MAAAAGHDRAGGSLRSRRSRRLAGRWARRRSCRCPRWPLSGPSRARPPIWRWPVALSARWPSRAFAQRVPARRACAPPPVAAVGSGLRVGRARAVAFCPAFFLCAGGGAAAWLSRPVSAARPAPSPSVSPPCRRPLAWFAPCCGVGRGGAASAPAGRLSVVGLGGLAAGRALFCVPSAGCRPASASCFAPAARLRALSLAAVPAFGWRWGGVVRSVSRGRVPLPPPRPRGAPPFPPSCSPSGRTRPGNFSGGRGPRSRALLPLVAVGCARGARPCVPAVSAVVLPPLACALRLAAPRAPSRAFARRSPPSSGWPGSAMRDVSSSSVRAWGTGTRLPALRSPPPIGGDSAHALHTKFCVQKIPGQETVLAGGRRGTAPARKTGANDAQNPLKCHQKAPALTRGGQKEGFPIPNGQQIGRKWAVKCRRAVCPSGKGQSVQRWRRAACTAANNGHKRHPVRPRSPCGTCNTCRRAGTGRRESSSRFRKSSEGGAEWRARACVAPLRCSCGIVTRLPPRAWSSFDHL